MSVDVFTMSSGALQTAKLVGFKGVEVLSRPFEFELFFTVPVGTDVRSAVATRATLTASRGGDTQPVAWHGVLVRIRLLRETAERALYQGTLVPKLWLARFSVRNHVFTKKKIDVIQTETLKHAGLAASEFRFSIDAGSYPEEELVCQYRESHLDFVNRWCEREGLYYYFEHPADDGATETMVVVDEKSQHTPLLGNGTVRYFPSGTGDGSAGECFRELHADFQAMPATVLITDYNYANPSAPVSGEQTVSGTGVGQMREYGYRVFTQGEATRLASVKAQSMACRELTLHATGNVLGVRAGYVFSLEDGPSDLPEKYLAIEVRHAGTVAAGTADIARHTGLDLNETYRVDVTAIPADVQFRAPQSTAWPRIYGFENGCVDGSATSQYAQIDDQGRYLVRFKFDASDLADGSTSTYLRMMQPHGGTIEGWHFPLRKGTEVMVAFQGGDPDRPVISGVVPNAHRPSTVTNKNHTQNVLRTGGNNHMVVEDLEGKQHIDLYTPVGETNVHMGGPSRHAFIVPPKTPNADPTFQAVDCTYYLYTDGTAGFNVTGDWWQNVGCNYLVDVTGDATIHYLGIHTLNVDSDSNELYNDHRNTTIHAGRTDKVEGGGMTQDIHGGLTQTIEPGGSQTVTGAWTHKVTAKNADEYGTWTSKVDKSWTATVGDNVSIESTKGTAHVKAKGITTIESAVEVKNKSPKWWKWSAFTVDLYGSKNSIGIQKLDVTGVAISRTTMKADFNGLKAEKTDMAMAYTGIKVDISGIKGDNKSLGLDVTELKLDKGTLSVVQGATTLWSHAFTKVG